MPITIQITLIYYTRGGVCDGTLASLIFIMEKKLNVFDVLIPDGGQISCLQIDKVTYFDLESICKLCFDTYDLHDVADTKVMSEFLRRYGDRYWVTIDGVRQLYRRVECKMCFEVIEKLKKL